MISYEGIRYESITKMPLATHIEEDKDTILRNGSPIRLSSIREKIQSMSLFRDFVVLGIETRACEVPVLAVVDENSRSILTIMVELSKVLSKLEMPEKIVCINSIPLLENGMVDMQKIKKLFESK